MKKRAQTGFTLLEIMAVIIIIGILGAVILPNVMGTGEKAKVSAARTDMAQISAELDLFKLEIGRHPTSQEGLDALLKNPGGIANWNGPYTKKKEMKDPWLTDYKYTTPGANGQPFELKSLGADRQEGGEGVNADIIKN
ncbi:MAG: type II secretion system protein GspG [Betaproteobacteria bacterium]|nr:MAG: type II secretion system protein GspG [Betaproteobacteria bacterium]